MISPRGTLVSSAIGKDAQQSLIKTLQAENYPGTEKLYGRPIRVKAVGNRSHHYVLRTTSEYRQFLTEMAKRDYFLFVLWGIVDQSNQIVSYEVVVPHLTHWDPQGNAISRAFASLSKSRQLSTTQQTRLVAKTIAMIFESSAADFCPSHVSLASNAFSARKLQAIKAMLRESLGPTYKGLEGYKYFLTCFERELHLSNCRAHLKSVRYHAAAVEAYQAIRLLRYPRTGTWEAFLAAYDKRFRKNVLTIAKFILPERRPEHLPTARSAFEYLASSISQSENFSEDIKLWDQLASEKPDDPVPVVFKATTYSYRHDYRRSIAIYEDLIRTYPTIAIIKLKAAGAYGGLAAELSAPESATEIEKARRREACLVEEAWAKPRYIIENYRSTP